jgi:hypothetical protein
MSHAQDGSASLGLQDNRKGGEELARGRVNLLPEGEAVVSALVGGKGGAGNPVEDEEGDQEVSLEGDSPGDGLGHARDNVDQNLARCQQHQVDHPGPCSLTQH